MNLVISVQKLPPFSTLQMERAVIAIRALPEFVPCAYGLVCNDQQENGQVTVNIPADCPRGSFCSSKLLEVTLY